MTDVQKRQILEMKANGYGYKAISTMLDMSMNTVKSFLRRKAASDASLSAVQSEGLGAKPALAEGSSAGRTVSAISDASEGQRYNANDATYTKCKQCGSPVLQISGMKRRVFCAPSCRVTWWNAHRALPQRKSVRQYTCACCGERFFSNIPARKFCSRSCYLGKRYGKEAKQDVS